MRALMSRCDAGPMREADLLAVLKPTGPAQLCEELAAWVHGTGELPLPALLERHGIEWQQESAPPAQRLGLRVSESGALVIKNVLRDSVAEAAGPGGGRRMARRRAATRRSDTELPGNVRKLDDVALYAAATPN